MREPLRSPARADQAARAELSTPLPKRLLLGLGNDILTDDAIGLRVVREIRKRLGESSIIEVLESSEMGIALLDYVVGFDELLLIDAIETGLAKPGFLHELDLAAFKSYHPIAPHFLGVPEVLALGRQLGMAVPARLRIFAVEVADPYTVGGEMTLAVRQALPLLVERIMQECRSDTTAAGWDR